MVLVTLHLGENVSVDGRNIIAIIDLSRDSNMASGAMMREIRKQNRILAKQGIVAKSAVICGGARKPGGVTENPRIYLSAISAVTLAQRSQGQDYKTMLDMQHDEM